MSSPAMIGIDWGTSSFRASLVAHHGEALESRESPHGILAVPDRDFAGFLTRTLAPWLEAHPGLPVLASGMITSRNGWIETPYQPLPLGIDELARSLVSKEIPSLGRVHFITGAALSPEGERPDVLRGEETEIFGYLTTHGVRDGTFLLPGTHNKWLTVESGRITRFVTCMTGNSSRCCANTPCSAASWPRASSPPRRFDAAWRPPDDIPANYWPRCSPRGP